MIKSLLLSGAEGSYATKLPVWNRALTFAPGLTIVAGGNGTGKSTVLKALGALTNLEGLSSGMAGRIPDFNSTREPERQIAKWSPDRIASEMVAQCLRLGASPTVELDWDRTAVSLFRADTALSTPRYLGETDDIASELKGIFEKREFSSGQRIMASLNRTLAQNAQASVPLFAAQTLKGFNSHWSTRAEAWNRWIGQVAEAGIRTVLMDEPDQSLSPLAQVRLWAQIAKMIETNAMQVIAVSHSPFALAYGSVIETQPGYATDVRMAVIESAMQFRSGTPAKESAPQATPVKTPPTTASRSTPKPPKPKAKARRRP